MNFTAAYSLGLAMTAIVVLFIYFLAREKQAMSDNLANIISIVSLAVMFWVVWQLYRPKH